MTVRHEPPSRRSFVITNLVLVLVPLLVVGILVAAGAQPASRVRSILMVVFGVETLILLLPSSWIRTGGVRPFGGLISPGEFRAFMRENRAMAQSRPWGTELAAIGPAAAFVLVALSFLVFR